MKGRKITEQTLINSTTLATIDSVNTIDSVHTRLVAIDKLA